MGPLGRPQRRWRPDLARPSPTPHSRVPLLADDEARRIEDEMARTSSPEVLRRWLGQVLADRRARSGLILSLSRQLHHLRVRIRQASAYLEGLTDGALKVAAEPWPRQLPCPRCGAPASGVRTRPSDKPGGHEQMTQHPDGTLCTEAGQPEKPSQPPG